MSRWTQASQALKSLFSMPVTDCLLNLSLTLQWRKEARLSSCYAVVPQYPWGLVPGPLGEDVQVPYIKWHRGVPSWLSALRNQHRHCCDSSSIPGLGTFVCCGNGQNKKEEWSINTGYNIDERWKTSCLVKEATCEKLHVAWLHLYEMFRTGKSTGT